MAKQIITPEAALSYPALFVPKKAPGSDAAKYSATLVFAPTTDIEPLLAAALEVATEKWGATAKDLIKKGKLHWPFRQDDDKGYPEGATFINASSKNPVGVVDLYKDPKTGKARVIEDASEVYAGAIVRAQVSFFTFDTGTKKGVGIGLNNVQKLRDGERLDGRKKAEDVFGAEDAAPAKFGDAAEDDMFR